MVPNPSSSQDLANPFCCTISSNASRAFCMPWFWRVLTGIAHVIIYVYVFQVSVCVSCTNLRHVLAWKNRTNKESFGIAAMAAMAAVAMAHLSRNKPSTGGLRSCPTVANTKFPASNGIAVAIRINILLWGSMFEQKGQLFMKPIETIWNQIKSWFSQFLYKTKNISQNLKHDLNVLKTRNTTKSKNMA